MNWFTKGEILTPCFSFDLNRSANKKKMCSRMCVYVGGAVVLEKNDNIFIERKDDILLS